MKDKLIGFEISDEVIDELKKTKAVDVSIVELLYIVVHNQFQLNKKIEKLLNNQ